MAKTLILIRGLPGSGKTTLATVLAQSETIKYPICSEDDYYRDENGVYNWSSEKEIIAKRKCLEETIRFMELGCAKVFVTNVFLSHEDIDPYLQIAKDLKYQCHVLIAQNTHGNTSIHNVKPEDFAEMKRQFEIVL